MGQYKYFNYFSAGIDFTGHRRRILTSKVGPRAERVIMRRREYD